MEPEPDVSKMSDDEFQQFRSERYARQLVSNAFLPEVENWEENEQAKRIYERLKTDLKIVFDEVLPISPRCPLCGKFRQTPTKGLMAYQLAERLHEAYERQTPQFDDETREEAAVPWAQLPEQNRLFRIAVCAELLTRHVVIAADEAASKE